MNTYSPDNSAIIDATGKAWPVETPHLLPLPEGIYAECVIANGINRAIAFNHNLKWQSGIFDDSTHWLARRPLPPVPKVKTQAELDEEFVEREFKRAYSSKESWVVEIPAAIRAGIAYARKGAHV